MDDIVNEPEEIGPETKPEAGKTPVAQADPADQATPVASEVPAIPDAVEGPTAPAVETTTGPAAEIELPPSAGLVHEAGPAVMTPHGPEYPRFRLMARIEHIMLLISFTILCLTGLPQKFPFSPISQGLISFLGGIETVRYINRWAAIVLILGSVVAWVAVAITGV
ncbi:MAG TPA: hypothetical protein PKE20_14630, partial [Promineifilum sp.]|nr:hypothetical protein [Promineifilum sp.]